MGICSEVNPRKPWQARRNTKYFGCYGRDEMAAAYAISDFTILPTWHDPCSRCVLEGIAARKPAITTRWNGASEILDRFDCGVVMEEMTDQNLVQAIHRMNDEDFRRNLAANTPASLEEISIVTHVSRLRKLYGDILKQKEN